LSAVSDSRQSSGNFQNESPSLRPDGCGFKTREGEIGACSAASVFMVTTNAITILSIEGAEPVAGG